MPAIIRKRVYNYVAYHLMAICPGLSAIYYCFYCLAYFSLNLSILKDLTNPEIAKCISL